MRLEGDPVLPLSRCGHVAAAACWAQAGGGEVSAVRRGAPGLGTQLQGEFSPGPAVSGYTDLSFSLAVEKRGETYSFSTWDACGLKEQPAPRLQGSEGPAGSPSRPSAPQQPPPCPWGSWEAKPLTMGCPSEGLEGRHCLSSASEILVGTVGTLPQGFPAN